MSASLRARASMRVLLRTRPSSTLTTASRLLLLQATPTTGIPTLSSFHVQQHQQLLQVRALSTFYKPEDATHSTKPTQETTDDEDHVREGHRSMVHFKFSPNKHPLNVTKLDASEKVWENPTQHSVWTQEEVDEVKITHLQANDWTSKVAYTIAQTLRFSFDLLAGFKTRKATEAMYLNRVCFLETVAGVPGFAAGMIRHLHSLRRMERDHGWIHTLLEEAENERMHLLTFLQLKQPGFFFRSSVMVVQGVFFNIFFFAYLVNPKICHRLVGYIEEEAVKTYTHIIDEMDAGNLPLFNHIVPPPIAMSYWKLAPDASFRDLLLAIRKDEATHREVNHTFASLKEHDYNPYVAHQQYLSDVISKKQKK